MDSISNVQHLITRFLLVALMTLSTSAMAEKTTQMVILDTGLRTVSAEASLIYGPSDTNEIREVRLYVLTSNPPSSNEGGVGGVVISEPVGLKIFGWFSSEADRFSMGEGSYLEPFYLSGYAPFSHGGDILRSLVPPQGNRRSIVPIMVI